MFNDDTIAAISSAPGEGGIGIVRISGDNSLNILNKIFKGYKNRGIEDLESYTMRYGFIYDGEKKIDEVIVSFMKSPKTYTTEDIVEIYCHGGPIPVRRILETVLKTGARLAEPGEFTKRAFLNGRIDLSQAEAVVDMIRSKTEKSADAALNQLQGALANQLKKIKESLIDIMAHIEATIDFPDEDIDDVLYESLIKDCDNSIHDIDKLIKTADTGKILREGLNTVIVGRPNVGKSSLLNALINENRAIVTDVPGTTRDVIEEQLNIRGIPVNLIDTAGIRKTNDVVEKIGVEKTKEYFNKADIIIFMLDSSEEYTEEDEEIFKLIKDKKTIILINKVDLPEKLDRSKIDKYKYGKTIIDVSIKDNKGIDLLKDEIYNFVYSGEVKYNQEILVTNIRHKNLLIKAKDSLINAKDTIVQKLPLDFVSIDLREALDSIGEITGETIQEDIVNRIFSKFCIGK
jgi:tRNA modification GTPase